MCAAVLTKECFAPPCLSLQLKCTNVYWRFIKEVSRGWGGGGEGGGGKDTYLTDSTTNIQSMREGIHLVASRY